MDKQRVVFNLQRFAGPDEGEEGVETGEVASPDTEQQEEGKEKDVSKVVAARLGHERKKLEAEYGPKLRVLERQAKASGMSLDEYVAYVESEQDREELEAEADKTGKSPDTIKAEREAAEAKARADKLERKERLSAEEKQMVADPVLGKFVSDHLKDIRKIAEDADVPLDAALAVVVRNNLPDLLKQTDPAYHKDAIIKDYLAGIRKGQKPLDISGEGTVIEKTSPKTFDEALKQTTDILKALQT